MRGTIKYTLGEVGLNHGLVLGPFSFGAIMYAAQPGEASVIGLSRSQASNLNFITDGRISEAKMLAMFSHYNGTQSFRAWATDRLALYANRYHDRKNAKKYIAQTDTRANGASQTKWEKTHENYCVDYLDQDLPRDLDYYDNLALQ